MRVNSDASQEQSNFISSIYNSSSTLACGGMGFPSAQPSLNHSFGQFTCCWITMATVTGMCAMAIFFIQSPPYLKLLALINHVNSYLYSFAVHWSRLFYRKLLSTGGIRRRVRCPSPGAFHSIGFTMELQNYLTSYVSSHQPREYHKFSKARSNHILKIFY